MGKKIFGILITLSLLLSLCLTASIPVMAAATWYVDGSVGSSGDGSYGSPFKTIPEAITAASTGDIIIVADVDTSSTTATDYSISSVITVNKSVTIKAAVDTAMAQVVINNSSGNVFDITADNVTIDGFAISCSSRAIYVSGADYCTVMNNNIISSVFGVDMSSANSCTVADNNIGYFTDMGIELSSSNANIVSGNTCENSYVGSNYIVYMESSNANIIIDNTCSGSSTGIAVTSSSDDNTIAGNTVSACTTGIRISDGSNNIISCNETSGSTSGGISIGTSSNNSFLYNTSSSNLLGVQIGSGVDTSEIYFSYNNITNSTWGVYFESTEGIDTLDATYNYWSGNNDFCNAPGRIDSSNALSEAISYSYNPVSSVTTVTATTTSTSTSTTTEVSTTTEISTTTSITTAVETETTTATTSLTTTKTDTDTVVRTQTSISTVPEGTVTLLNPTTLTETQSVTSTGTEIRTTTQSATVTDTQSATITVVLPQTFTATTTLNVAQETMNWPVTIFISVGALLAGGLIVTIIVRKV